MSGPRAEPLKFTRGWLALPRKRVGTSTDAHYPLSLSPMILSTVPSRAEINPNDATLINSDVLDALMGVQEKSVNLVVSSPPYNIGKIYERDRKLTFDEYLDWQRKIAKRLSEIVTEDGSICWQVGNYIKDGAVVPLDVVFYPIFAELGLKLRNRVVWRFNFGQNLDRRFSGRYETMLWFTRSDEYKFNLDPVRVPQIYPGKRHAKAKGEKAGHGRHLPAGHGQRGTSEIRG